MRCASASGSDHTMELRRLPEAAAPAGRSPGNVATRFLGAERSGGDVCHARHAEHSHAPASRYRPAARSGSLRRRRPPAGARTDGSPPSSSSWTRSCKRFVTLHLHRTQPAHTCIFQRLPQAPLHQIVLDDVSKQIAPLGGCIEMNRGARRSIPHMHMRISAGTRIANGRPYTQLVQQGDGRWRQANDAKIHFVLDRPRPGARASSKAGGEALRASASAVAAPTMPPPTTATSRVAAATRWLATRHGWALMAVAPAPHAAVRYENPCRAWPANAAAVAGDQSQHRHRAQRVRTAAVAGRQAARGHGSSSSCLRDPRSDVRRSAPARASESRISGAATSSASVSASRRPRLKPCAPIG